MTINFISIDMLRAKDQLFFYCSPKAWVKQIQGIRSWEKFSKYCGLCLGERRALSGLFGRRIGAWSGQKSFCSGIPRTTKDINEIGPRNQTKSSRWLNMDQQLAEIKPGSLHILFNHWHQLHFSFVPKSNKICCVLLWPCQLSFPL